MTVPLKVLVEKIRRAGAGDFGPPVEIADAGQLSELASALNEMCDQLAAARNAAEEKTRARISAVEASERSLQKRAIERLASGIAHELGTPMNVASVRAELIAELASSDDVIVSAQVIKGQIDAMAGAIRRMLDFARARAPKKERIDLARLIARSSESIQANIKGQAIRVRLESPQSSLMIEADPLQIEQVLGNVLTNAVDALPNGGDICIQLDRGEHQRPRLPQMERVHSVDCARVRIRDNGIGISKENLPRIFDPFFSMKLGSERAGLGLAVASWIVDDHAGWIEVESEPGQGACFSVFLPIPP